MYFPPLVAAPVPLVWRRLEDVIAGGLSVPGQAAGCGAWEEEGCYLAFTFEQLYCTQRLSR